MRRACSRKNAGQATEMGHILACAHDFRKFYERVEPREGPMDSQEGQVGLGLGRPGAGHVLASAGTDVSLSLCVSSMLSFEGSCVRAPSHWGHVMGSDLHGDFSALEVKRLWTGGLFSRRRNCCKKFSLAKHRKPEFCPNFLSPSNRTPNENVVSVLLNYLSLPEFK